MLRTTRSINIRRVAAQALCCLYAVVETADRSGLSGAAREVFFLRRLLYGLWLRKDCVTLR